MTQPPPPPSPWAPPREEPAEMETAAFAAVEPDTAAIQVDPSMADTAAHPQVTGRATRPAPPLGPKPPVLLNPLPRPSHQPTDGYPDGGPPAPSSPAVPPPPQSPRAEAASRHTPPVQAPPPATDWGVTQETPSPWSTLQGTTAVPRQATQATPPPQAPPAPHNQPAYPARPQGQPSQPAPPTQVAPLNQPRAFDQPAPLGQPTRPGQPGPPSQHQTPTQALNPPHPPNQPQALNQPGPLSQPQAFNQPGPPSQPHPLSQPHGLTHPQALNQPGPPTLGQPHSPSQPQAFNRPGPPTPNQPHSPSQPGPPGQAQAFTQPGPPAAAHPLALSQPQAMVGQPQAAAATKGWWRRNMWGLIVLLPVLALALGPSAKDGLDMYNRVDAHEAVVAGSDGWVSYSGARLRLASFGPATDLKKYDGTPFEPPGRTKAWRATITVEAADKERIQTCNLALEDTEGRLFDANPNEMAGTRILFASCTPDEDDAPSPWQVVVYFVTPESAQPAAVRISRALELPRYARLETS